MSTPAVYLQAMGLSCALGADATAVREGLFAARPPLVPPTDAFSPGRPLALGVAAVPPGVPRTHALASQALAGIAVDAARAVDRFGPGRVAVVVGSSTAGVAEGEAAQIARATQGHWPAGYHYTLQEMVSPARHVAHAVGAAGPVYGISTACSSGAKALAAGARLLQAGLADAVVCGGADALCRLTVAGFSALESVSGGVCNPMSRHRDGIHLGEGAALFLLGREPGPLRLAGWGETSDAHHMSAPDPTGRGAEDAMRRALQRAGLGAGAIDYLNLHGTATPHNDAMESRAVAAVFGGALPASSTKPLTGHTLAAAGALEAAFCWLTLVDNAGGRLPPHWWDGAIDETLPALHLVRPGETAPRPPRTALSNSFAFGGSNVSLLFASE